MRPMSLLIHPVMGMITAFAARYAVMDQVASAMENIREAALQMASSTKQAERAAHDLHNLGQRLQEIVKFYKV